MINKISFHSVALCTIVTASTVWSTLAHADIILVDANTPPCPIIVNAKEHPLEGRAANQLAIYLKKITGHTFEVQPLAEPLPERAIVVGQHSNAPLNQLGQDGFLIRTKGQRLHILGGGEQGTAYGVYDFLERQLGCRWWSYNEELVPQKTSIKIGDLDIKEVPRFAVHDIMSREAQTADNDFHLKSRAKDTLQFTGNHTMYKMLTEAAKANPEFWPMNEKGERKPNNLHFNYLAPGIAEALAEELAKEVEKRKGNLDDFIYFAGQGDWYDGLDQSPESKKVYEEETWTDAFGHKRPGLSAPLVRMMNKTGAILQKKYPGIKVGTFAYMSTDSPPGKTRPAENVSIWLPRLRYGITLGIEEAASEKNPEEKWRARSQMIMESIKQWSKLAPDRLYIWEYGVNYTHFLKPQPVLRAMAQNIKFYDKHGIKGVMIQGNYVSLGGDLVVLKNYVWSKLLWNPKLDTETLIKEFCHGYYGPAAADILDYVNTLEDSVRKPKYMELNEFNQGTPFLTPEVEAKMQAALKRAEAKTQGEANAEYYRRVREAGISMDALKLWTSGPLIENDGKLLRGDINPENGGEYTHPRAMEMLKYTRGSSKNEWGTGVTQQRGIVSANGGPIYSLARGTVTAKIAPYQGWQRLWGLLFNGREIIRHSIITPGGDYFLPVGEPTADKIEIEGETGYASWKPTPDHAQRETFTFDDDGALVWSGSFRQLLGNPTTVVPRADTSYPVKDLAEAQQAKVELRTVAGWQVVPIAEHNAKGIPSLKTIAPINNFQLRLTTADGKVSVLDTYRGLAVTGYSAAYIPGSKAISTHVQMDKLETDLPKKTVPAYERSLKLEAAQ